VYTFPKIIMSLIHQFVEQNITPIFSAIPEHLDRAAVVELPM
jgi:hypothetical protein